MKAVAIALVSALGWLLSAAALGAPVDDRYVERLGEIINRYRIEHGGKPLALAARLASLARQHSEKMANEERLSHDGFEQRFASAASPHCVENVAMRSGTPQATFEAWRDSPVHARNLLDPGIARMGVGIAGRYVTFFACR